MKSKYYKSDDDDAVKIKVEGFIDETKYPPVFKVTNYDECINAGLIGYIAPKKTTEDEDREIINVREMIKKYTPEYIKNIRLN